MDRRVFLATAASAAAVSAGGCAATDKSEPKVKRKYQGGTSPWPIALDTATIRPADRPIALEEKVRIAADAGYDAIELWEFELNEHEQKGGNLKEMAATIRDAGL